MAAVIVSCTHVHILVDVWSPEDSALGTVLVARWRYKRGQWTRADLRPDSNIVELPSAAQLDYTFPRLPGRQQRNPARN